MKNYVSLKSVSLLLCFALFSGILAAQAVECVATLPALAMYR